MQQLYLELRLHVDPVVVLRSFAAVSAMARPWYRAPASSFSPPLRVHPGDRRRAVRYAADDLVNFHPADKPVVQSDHRHVAVERAGDDGEQRRLLAAVPRR